MAEFLAIIGAVGAIANIIDATTKAISTIAELRSKWKDADLTLLSLTSQLSAFRAALRRIQEWRDNDASETHHQLIMDLDETLSCCSDLVARIEIISVDWLSTASKQSRWKVTSGTKGIDKILALVERQTSALTLLLTACNCQTLSEQKALLERPQAREVLFRANAESASLFVLRDTDSIRSKVSDNLARLSVTFDFDPHVLSSAVYNRIFRGSMKNLLRQQHEEHKSQRRMPATQALKPISLPPLNSNLEGPATPALKPIHLPPLNLYRESKFATVDDNCCVCEEPLVNTLRGERVLQFSCRHNSHEACFYEYIRVFESDHCPACDGILELVTRDGSAANLERLRNIVRGTPSTRGLSAISEESGDVLVASGSATERPKGLAQRHGAFELLSTSKGISDALGNNRLWEQFREPM